MNRRLDDCTCIYDLSTLGFRTFLSSANVYNSLWFHAVSMHLRCWNCVCLMLTVSVTESLLRTVFATSMSGLWKMISHQFVLYFWLDFLIRFCAVIFLFPRIWHFLVRSVFRMNGLLGVLFLCGILGCLPIPRLSLSRGTYSPRTILILESPF